MSILPTFMQSAAEEDTSTTESAASIPIEYGMDFETGQLTGLKVEGIEAVKVWVWNCLHTQRFRHAIYSWDYGADIEQYIGVTVTQEYLETDCRDEVEDTLKVNPYIQGISEFYATITDDKLYMRFLINTTFGDEEVNINV